MPVLAAMFAAAVACAQPQFGTSSRNVFDVDPPESQGVAIEEKVGTPLPMDLVFTNSRGERVRVGDYFKSVAQGGKPAVVALVYYKCPVVCDVVLEKMAICFNDLDLTIGPDFNVYLFSFDDRETADDARAYKMNYIAGYNRATEETAAAWEFHVGDAPSNRALANAFGFPYKQLDNGEYSHPVALFVVTPEGRISRYIHGFDYPVRDVKLSLIDASEGRLSRSLGDRLMAFCYMYDPTRGGYALQAVRVMQVSGVVTMLVLGVTIGGLFLGERARRRLTRAERRSRQQRRS